MLVPETEAIPEGLELRVAGPSVQAVEPRPVPEMVWFIKLVQSHHTQISIKHNNVVFVFRYILYTAYGRQMIRTVFNVFQFLDPTVGIIPILPSLDGFFSMLKPPVLRL